MSKTALIFSAQGERGHLISGELAKSESVFHNTLLACDKIVRLRLGWSILEELESDKPASIQRYHERVQPLLTSVQIALARLLSEWEIKVDAASGLSMGEVAAFHVAGIYNLADTLEVVCAQSELAKREGMVGKMVLVRARTGSVEDTIPTLGNDVYISVRLSRTAAVIAGECKAIDDFIGRLSVNHVQHRTVNVGMAYHTPIVGHLESIYRSLLRPIQALPAQIPVYSSVTGSELSSQETELGFEYWWKIFSARGRFDAMVRSLLRDGFRSFVEVAPSPTLGHFINEVCHELGVIARVSSIGFDSVELKDIRNAIISSVD